MGRLIDADALYEMMQKQEELARKRVLDTDSTLPYPNNLNPSFTRYSAQLDERTQFKHMIADAPTVPQWVPVSERLPEEEDEYLVTIKDSTGTWTSSHDFDGEEFGFYAHKDDELIWCPVKNVVAWQPLPEPYKEG